MKKTLMLVALFITIAVTSNAQSTYPVQDTLTAVAPHLPTITRYSGTGSCWHGLNHNYTISCRDSILAWALAYPWEAVGYRTSIGNYLNTTTVSTLSSGEAELYHDLKAAWMIEFDR